MKQKKSNQEKREGMQESVNTSQQLHQSVNPEEKKLKIDKKNNFLFVFAILITGIIAYLNSFDCSFHFDDAYIFNSSVTAGSASIGDWLRLFPTRPIGILTFAINYNIHKLDVWGYHFINLSIHLINAFLVWWLTWLTLSTPVMKDSEISKHKINGGLFNRHPFCNPSLGYTISNIYSSTFCFTGHNVLSFNFESFYSRKTFAGK
jgi:hypothetical protein